MQRPTDEVPSSAADRPEDSAPADTEAAPTAVPASPEAAGRASGPAETPAEPTSPAAPTAATPSAAEPAPVAASAAPEAVAPEAAGSPAEAPPTDGAEQARLMAEAGDTARAAVTPKRGGRVTGKIVQIGEDGAFIDFGGREEAVLDRRELLDAEGNLTKQVGDTIKATVTRVEGGVRLTLKARASGDLVALLAAHKAGTPVEGKVTGVNKGGLVVNSLGVRAFCPFSQIDRHYVENPAEYVGKRLTFRISSADERGKNVVLSRRAHLEEEVREKAAALRDSLAVGQRLKGVVARIRPFGAFVDLGGIDGLVHVSEVSHRRVKDPSEVLAVGQEVEVAVVKIDNLGGADERISLSLKELETDPWRAAVEALVPGERVRGKVVRIVDFGAFVEIAPGIDGLVHVSALVADRRIGHPSEVVNAGDEVEPWVLAVDPQSRRISLSLVDPALRPERTESGPEGGGRGGRREGGRRGGRDRDGRGGGGESREVREYRERARPTESGMTSMEEAFRRARERTDDD